MCASELTPFVCTDQAYQLRDQAIYAVDLSIGTSSNVSPPAGIDYNAL